MNTISNISSIQIPLVLNYQIKISKNFTIAPSFGFYYSYGVKATGTADAGTFDVAVDLYKDNDLLKRSDFGFKTGVIFHFSGVGIGFNYEAGLVGMLNSVDKTVDKTLDNPKATTNLFAISLSYRFLKK